MNTEDKELGFPKDLVALSSCEHSSNKPFCGKTHAASAQAIWGLVNMPEAMEF